MKIIQSITRAQAQGHDSYLHKKARELFANHPAALQIDFARRSCKTRLEPQPNTVLYILASRWKGAEIRPHNGTKTYEDITREHVRTLTRQAKTGKLPPGTTTAQILAARTPRGSTALHNAAAHGCVPKDATIEDLTTTKNHNGLTPLHMAVQHSKLHCLKPLITKKLLQQTDSKLIFSTWDFLRIQITAATKQNTDNWVLTNTAQNIIGCPEAFELIDTQKPASQPLIQKVAQQLRTLPADCPRRHLFQKYTELTAHML